MVWDGANRNGGFSEGTPWLPVSRGHFQLSVAAQEDAPEALLHHYRKALSFRHSHKALMKGAHGKLRAEGEVLSFERSHADETVFCAFNLSDTPAVIDMPEGDWRQIGAELGAAAPQADGKLHLGPWQSALALHH